jgi:hypothetical protein
MSEVNQEEARSDVEERLPHADVMKLVRNWAGALRRVRIVTSVSRSAVSESEERLDLVGRQNEGSMKR